MEYENPAARNITDRDKVWNPKTRTFDQVTGTTTDRKRKITIITTINESIELEPSDKVTCSRPWCDEKLATEQMLAQTA